MSYDKLVGLVEKYAQQVQVTQTAPSIFDLFRQLPQPAVPLNDEDGSFSINVSVLPGPRIAFNVVSQKLNMLKASQPQDQAAVARMQKVVTGVHQFFVQHYANQMLAAIKKNVTPEEYAEIRSSGVPGEFTVWTL